VGDREYKFMLLCVCLACVFSVIAAKTFVPFLKGISIFSALWFGVFCPPPYH
jgi:hypothetical protein